MSDQPIPALGLHALTPWYDLAVETFGFGKKLKEKVLDVARLANGERLLDVGCGTATLLIAASARASAAQLVGVDPDERILSIARQKLDKRQVEATVIRAGAEQLPFDPGSFDVVVSTLVFHHLPTATKKRAMEEISRVLTPQGRFILADIAQAEGIALKIAFALGKLIQPKEAERFQDNRQGKLPVFLEEAGFAVQEVAPRYRGVQFLVARPKEISA